MTLFCFSTVRRGGALFRRIRFFGIIALLPFSNVSFFALTLLVGNLVVD